MAFDSPMKPLAQFPGVQDGSGVYGDNPSLPKPQDGPDKHKFFEEVPKAPSNEFDSPMDRAMGKLGESAPYAPSGGKGASGSDNWDTPLKPLKKM